MWYWILPVVLVSFAISVLLWYFSFPLIETQIAIEIISSLIVGFMYAYRHLNQLPDQEKLLTINYDFSDI